MGHTENLIRNQSLEESDDSDVLSKGGWLHIVEFPLTWCKHDGALVPYSYDDIKSHRSSQSNRGPLGQQSSQASRTGARRNPTRSILFKYDFQAGCCSLGGFPAFCSSVWRWAYPSALYKFPVSKCDAQIARLSFMPG